ncbi:MAG: hypothetical protein KIT14_04740 [bacterium]|nr:hypothetical protein [bacterium]
MIQLREERLTAQLDDVSLDEVIALFSAASGAEVRGAPVGTRQVSAEFADVPLYEGLSRLLGEQNFTLTFREDGSVKTLRLLGGPQEPVPATQVVRAGDAAPNALSTAELMQHRVPILPGSRLSQHLGGGDSASLQQLLETSLRESDPGIRSEALRAGLGGVEAEPTLREATIKALGDIDDHTLENVVRAVARDNARELVAQVSTFTKINEVRTRGFALLRQLNQSGGGQ